MKKRCRTERQMEEQGREERGESEKIYGKIRKKEEGGAGARTGELRGVHGGEELQVER